MNVNKIQNTKQTQHSKKFKTVKVKGQASATHTLEKISRPQVTSWTPCRTTTPWPRAPSTPTTASTPPASPSTSSAAASLSQFFYPFQDHVHLLMRSRMCAATEWLHTTPWLHTRWRRTCGCASEDRHDEKKSDWKRG